MQRKTKKKAFFSPPSLHEGKRQSGSLSNLTGFKNTLICECKKEKVVKKKKTIKAEKSHICHAEHVKRKDMCRHMHIIVS